MSSTIDLARRWAFFPALLLALLLLIHFWQTMLHITCGTPGAPLDDAWIHFQFARNLSQGHGFSYVPGVPTAGSTAPLWTLLLASIGLFTADFLLPGLFLSAIFFLATVWLTYHLTLELTGQWGVALLAAFGVATTGRLLWAGLSAMEVTLFTTLSLAAVWVYQKRGLDGITALLFALASQTRPEGHVLFALAVADSVFRKPYTVHGSRTTFHALRFTDYVSRFTFHVSRITLLAILVYALIQLPYALFSLSLTGKPLPNTFYAKSSSPVPDAALYSLRTLREIGQYHWQDNFLTLLLLPVGLVALWRRNRLVVGWLLGLALITPLIVPLLWHHGRYTMPLIPFQMIAAAAGLGWLIARLRRAPRLLWAIAVVAFLLAGLWRAPYWAGMLGYNTREIQEIDVAMGQWLAANIPPDEPVAIDDIGAITFFSPRPIVDLHGLVSPQMWPILNDPEPTSALIHFLASQDVRLLAIFPDWHPLLVADPAIARPIQRFTTSTHSIIFAPEAAVYEMDWPYRQSIAPQIEAAATFGDAIHLRGFDWAEQDGMLDLTLYWESVTAVSTSYKLFIHILDAEGNLIAQADRPPVNGLAPTHRWQPGDLVRDPLQLPFPPGAAEARVGLYTEENGRLPITSADSVDNALVLRNLAAGD
jgi:arabinofuranosyltransferase